MAEPMSPREVLAVMVRTDRGQMTVWTPREVTAALDAYRAEVLREAQDATVAWLEKRAAEERSAAWQEEKRRATARARARRERADLISTLASKVARGAVHEFRSAAPPRPTPAAVLREIADEMEAADWPVHEEDGAVEAIIRLRRAAAAEAGEG
ncbi:hypothetical protein [Streptomyces sp. URMC 129]|uniref:hypothetical protein n=1 Tax=Streptomyces sp. URMC 129 TaxID=3423407 RepID=UPI003F1B80D2